MRKEKEGLHSVTILRLNLLSSVAKLLPAVVIGKKRGRLVGRKTAQIAAPTDWSRVILRCQEHSIADTTFTFKWIDPI